MKIAICAALVASSMLAGCAGGGGWGGNHGYYYQGRHWDRREKVCDVRPNGRKVCTWRYY